MLDTKAMNAVSDVVIDFDRCISMTHKTLSQQVQTVSNVGGSRHPRHLNICQLYSSLRGFKERPISLPDAVLVAVQSEPGVLQNSDSPHSEADDTRTAWIDVVLLSGA